MEEIKDAEGNKLNEGDRVYQIDESGLRWYGTLRENEDVAISNWIVECDDGSEAIVFTFYNIYKA